LTRIHSVIGELNEDELRYEFETAQPFPHLRIDGFLDPDFAREVMRSYPGYGEARAVGKRFFGVNENNKVQVSDSDRFPAPVATLAEALLSQSWLELLSRVTGIEHLVGDPTWQGGGMHLMSRGAHLDVHVDFNVTKQKLHRRLNVLVFLNEDWQPGWGGMLELWNTEVSTCVHSIAPVLNRCVIFATSEISYHGVTKVACPKDRARCSFAGYYHTHAAPEGWDGTEHGTSFRARPDEKLKGSVLMPLQDIAMKVLDPIRKRLDD